MAHIFVVDDEPQMVRYVRGLLEKDGHKVQEAFHGTKALDLMHFKKTKSGVVLPDLIILDVMMPEINGYELARLLAEDPDTSAIPILMLTGKAQPPDTVEIPPNIKVYLEKPFDPLNFIEMVSTIISDS